MIEQINSKGALEYFGSLVLGANNARANVVFDIGFDWSVVTSTNCISGCNTKVYNPS